MSTTTREGSSKDVITRRLGSHTKIWLQFSKRFSVKDVGPVPYLIPGMDLLRYAIAVKMFEVLQENDIRTHFIQANQDIRMIEVRPMNIYAMNQHYEDARGWIIPLEIIDRQEMTQPLIDRMQTDKELQVKCMVRATTPVVGTRFSTPLVECTTKYEAKDRRLTDAEAIALAKLGSQSYRELCEFVANASSVLTNFFAEHGFKRVDGKWEIAMLYLGQDFKGPDFMVVDSYSPDEMRLIGPDGRSYDKDPLRQWYDENFPEWVKRLKQAQEEWPNDKVKWPAYPPDIPPDSVLDDLVDRYTTVAKAIGAI